MKFGQVDQRSTAFIVLSPDPPLHCEEARLVVICISVVEVFVTGSQCESTLEEIKCELQCSQKHEPL